MNKLVSSSSPYLQQHAGNPINWNPWDQSVWKQAKSQNQLVIVSIGYSTCHWCHVMAHEVFEDQSVATYQNKNFLSIKVDREERPDLDKIYMEACQVLSGQGGWPLNAICLPDGRPVQACTYLSKDVWIRMLGQIHLLWLENPERLIQQADAVQEAVQQLHVMDPTIPYHADEKFRRASDEFFREIWSRISASCDTRYGGFSGAPKFPIPVLWESLSELSSNEAIQQQVHTTLDQMARNGIFDQIGGGFFRYSTDEHWHIPHFEKMLYDNAQLLSLYARAMRNAPSPLYRRVLRLTAQWLQDHMQSPEGLWYSALNADTKGVEGATYLWNQEQVFQAAPESEMLEEFLRSMDITSRGNWENGLSHLRLAPNISRDLSAMQVAQALEQFEPIRKSMLACRDKRDQPSRDEKVILEWNAYTAKGFLDAGLILDDQRLQTLGLNTLDALFTHMRDSNGNYYRTLTHGIPGEQAFLCDLTSLAEASLCAHEQTLSPHWLAHSSEVLEHILAHFHPSENGLYPMNSSLGESLYAQAFETRDDVLPSSNSTLARLLLRLGTLKEREDWITLGRALIQSMRETALNSPSSHPNWIRAIFDMLYPQPLVTIEGDHAQRWAREVWRLFPRVIISGKQRRSETTDATVCTDSACLPTVSTLKDLLNTLGKLR